MTEKEMNQRIRRLASKTKLKHLHPQLRKRRVLMLKWAPRHGLARPITPPCELLRTQMSIWCSLWFSRLSCRQDGRLSTEDASNTYLIASFCKLKDFNFSGSTPIPSIPSLWPRPLKRQVSSAPEWWTPRIYADGMCVYVQRFCSGDDKRLRLKHWCALGDPTIQASSCRPYKT